jgi:uncharacterized protein YbcI
MALKSADLIRQRVIRGFRDEITRIKTFIAGTSDNEVAVEALRDKSGEDIVAELVETLMLKIGQETKTPATDKSSKVRRQMASQRRVTA